VIVTAQGTFKALCNSSR